MNPSLLYAKKIWDEHIDINKHRLLFVRLDIFNFYLIPQFYFLALCYACDVYKGMTNFIIK